MGKAAKTAVAGLTHKQRLFVDAYVVSWNATESAKRAGYSEKTAQVIGSENLTKPLIAAEIDKRLKARHLSSEQVLSRLAEMANANIADLMDEDGKLDMTKLRAKGYLVKKVKIKRHFEGKGDDAELVEAQELELYDAQAALVHIGKHKKLFTEAVDVTSGGQPIKAYVNFSPEDWAKEKAS